VTFMHQVLLPRVFRSMMDPLFDERDANQAKTIHEFAKILYTLRTSAGADLFQQRTLPALMESFAVPVDILEAMRTVPSPAGVEECLTEFMKRVKRRS
jgi:hypothetical protein